MKWPFARRQKPDIQMDREKIHVIAEDVEDWVAPKWKSFLEEKNFFDGEMPLETMMAAFFAINFDAIRKAFPPLGLATIEIVVAVGGHGVEKSGTHSFEEVHQAIASLISLETEE